jgi:hypothetical protein
VVDSSRSTSSLTSKSFSSGFILPLLTDNSIVDHEIGHNENPDAQSDDEPALKTRRLSISGKIPATASSIESSFQLQSSMSPFPLAPLRQSSRSVLSVSSFNEADSKDVASNSNTNNLFSPSRRHQVALRSPEDFNLFSHELEFQYRREFTIPVMNSSPDNTSASSKFPSNIHLNGLQTLLKLTSHKLQNKMNEMSVQSVFKFSSVDAAIWNNFVKLSLLTRDDDYALKLSIPGELEVSFSTNATPTASSIDVVEDSMSSSSSALLRRVGLVFEARFGSTARLQVLLLTRILQALQ